MSNAQRAERIRQQRLSGTAPPAPANVKLWHILTIVFGSIATIWIGMEIIDAGYAEQAKEVLCMFARRC